MLDVKIKRLSDTAIMPTYGSEKAAGIDLYADLMSNPLYGHKDSEEASVCYIRPHETKKIGCGFAFQPPNGYCGLILARSGLATKNGLAPANKIGLCDEDYTGEYIITLHNHSNEQQIIHHGDRIAQLMFIPYEQANLIETDELDETARGDGGFGHSGR